MRSADQLSAQPPQRVDWVDYAKGICIILVVMMHTVNGVEHLFGQQGWMHHIVDFARPFRIPDFFLVAGLFLNRSIHGPLVDYLDRKVVHFIYFYVLWLTLQLPVLEFNAMVTHPGYFLKLWAYSFVEPTNSLWFVHMLAIFYVVTRLLRNLPVWIVLLGALVLQSLYQWGLIDTGWALIDRFANRYVYFFIGYAFAPQIFRFAQWAANAPWIGAFGLLAWSVLNWVGVRLELHESVLTSFIMGMAGATAVCVVSALLTRFRAADFLRYCGRHSIVIYLTYAFPLVAMERLVLPAIGAPFGDVGLASALTLALAVGLPLAFHALIRGTPLDFLYERPVLISLSGSERGKRRAALSTK
jgi:uncharacterized membrane protein YcfT